MRSALPMARPMLFLWGAHGGEGKGSARHRPFTSQCGSAPFVRSALPMARPMLFLWGAHGARPARLLSAQPMAKRLLAIRGGAGAWPPPLKAPHWLGLWPVRSSFAVRAPCAHQRKSNASHKAKRFQRRAGHRQGRERLARIATPFSTEGEAITRERHSRSTALCEGTADQQRPRSYGTAANQALKGFTAMMPQYNCPSLKSSVRMRSQPSRSAAATICAS